MKEIKHFCGYLNTKTPLQAGKLGKSINKSAVKFTNTDGKTVITNFSTFIAYRILVEKYIADTIEETHGYKYEYFFGRREKVWTKLDKPKVTYCMRNPDGSYYDLNKSQWEFAKWLSENFNDFESAIAVDFAITEKAEAEAEAAERAEIEAREREEKERIEKDNFKRECIEVAKQYIDTPLHESAVSMGKRYTDSFKDRSETYIRGICANLLLVYVYADKIENPLARQALIEWLHTGNKASPKCFEAWTGLKLPNTNSGRREFFKNLKRTDFELVQI